jgi:hypothetical protein
MRLSQFLRHGAATHVLARQRSFWRGKVFYFTSFSFFGENQMNVTRELIRARKLQSVLLDIEQTLERIRSTMDELPTVDVLQEHASAAEELAESLEQAKCLYDNLPMLG